MKDIKHILILALMIFPNRMQCQEQSPREVLIYTRNGEGYVHDNISASVKAIEEICFNHGIITTTSDDPGVFDSGSLNEFDGIIFSNSNNEAFLTEKQRYNFRRYIESGKGFMGIHSANASERGWKWYANMIGGKFVRHPELQSFDIKVIDSIHLSTKHLPSTWTWEDECYYSDHLNPDIRILLAVDLSTVEDPEKGIFPGTVFGNRFPLAWYRNYRSSRIFYTALGHKIEHYDDENFRKHLEGGILWILGGN